MPIDMSGANIFCKTRAFIETGAYTGNGVMAALNAGFRQVISIEIMESYYQHCIRRFSGDGRVELIMGDSRKLLPSILARFSEPVTLYLDAHCTDNAQVQGCSIEEVVLSELDIVKACGRKDHIIIVDDMGISPKSPEGLAKIVLDRLIGINDSYVLDTISYMDNPHFTWVAHLGVWGVARR